VGFTSKAQRVGTLLFRARSSQVTGVHTQNKVVQQQSDAENYSNKLAFSNQLQQSKMRPSKSIENKVQRRPIS
jgi:hypothetical protein